MISRAISLAAGWLLDLTLGDPAWLPHPIVGFGKLIAKGERRWNNGANRVRKGAFLAVGLVIGTFILTWCLLWIARALPSIIWGGKTLLRDAAGSGLLQGAMRLGAWLEGILSAILIFFCLAGTTLIHEVREVFKAVDRSLEEGRRQVGRIVGRDTSELSAQEIRTAALETLAENLNDGIIAPLFWLSACPEWWPTR